MSVETVALDYLRPYRHGGQRPIDIMWIQPATFQDWRISIKGEAMILEREGQTYTLNLKKLIVQLDKERGMFGRAMPATPRELAKMLIRPNVERQGDLKHLADSHQGMGWYGYNVSISGYFLQSGKRRYIDCWHIVVDEFEGEECAYIFDLREIYHEIELELKQGLVQPTLF